MSSGMLEVSGVPVVYADDIGAVEIVGNRVRVTYFEYRRIQGVLVKQPVLEMIRPLESFGRDTLREKIAMAQSEANRIDGVPAH